MVELVQIDRNGEDYKLTPEQQAMFEKTEAFQEIGGRITEIELGHWMSRAHLLGLSLESRTQIDTLTLPFRTAGLEVNLDLVLHMAPEALRAFEMHSDYPKLKNKTAFLIKSGMRTSLYKEQYKTIGDLDPNLLKVGIPTKKHAFYDAVAELEAWWIGKVYPSWSGVETWVNINDSVHGNRFNVRMNPGSLYGIGLRNRAKPGNVVIFHFDENAGEPLKEYYERLGHEFKVSYYPSWHDARMSIEMKE